MHWHIISPDPRLEDHLFELAYTGELDTLVVVNNYEAINRLAESGLVKNLLHRDVTGVSDTHDAPYGDERDIQRGYNEWKRIENQRAHRSLHPNVIIIPYGHNEKNYPLDGFWYYGLQLAVREQGIREGWTRRVGIFSDGVGNPPNLVRIAGILQPHPTWGNRVKSGCMRLGKEMGNVYVKHDYGRMSPVVTPDGRIVGMKETHDPGSALWFDDAGRILKRDDEAYYWFGGSQDPIYTDLIPFDSQMDIVLGEVGASAASLDGIGGIAGVVRDIVGYRMRLGQSPISRRCVKGFAYWTLGGYWPAQYGGFDYSTIERDPNCWPALMGLARQVKAARQLRAA